MENRAKMRDLISLGLEGEFIQFVPEILEHPLYTFLMTNLSLLSQKLRKNCTFRSISHCSFYF